MMFKFDLYNTKDKKHLPQAQTEGSAGLDVRTTEGITIHPNESVTYGTGVKMTECSSDTYLLMELRSSLRFKYGCSQLGIGIIDSDYRGEIRGLIHNMSNKEVTIKKGERIAQLIPVKKVSGGDFIAENRVGGFGSTNK